MARAHGARAQMALAFETTYGAAPASGWRQVPFASTSLGAEQPLLTSELLGHGRDPVPPIKDAVTADGDVVVPIDVENFGLRLKAAFGTPTTTGTAPGPFTHEFRSGSWTLPSLAIETSMPEVPRFALYTGCVADQLSWQMARSGLLTATVRLVAQGEAVAATSGAGTPTALSLQRFGHAGRHVDAVPADAIRRVGEAGPEAAGVVLGLADAGGVAEAGALGLDHGELAVAVAQHVIGRERVRPPAAARDPAGADHLAPDPRAADDTPSGLAQDGVDAVGAGVGFGLGLGHAVRRPAKAECSRDCRRLAVSDNLPS
jgi:hypothetical protein